MKRTIIVIVLALIFTCNFAYAKSNKNNMPYIKMNGSKFYLYYSAKSDETGSFINEYYKQNQSYASWDELIGLHHYPTAFYPIEHAKEFRDFLNASGSPATVEINDEDNSALLYFIVINNKRLPIVMEFNVFKLVKSPICGTVGFQYARRYLLNNALEVDDVKKNFAKGAIKYIKQVENVDIPDIVTVEIEKGQYVHPEEIGIISKDKVEEVKSEKEIKSKKELKAEAKAAKLKEKENKEELKAKAKADKVKEKEAKKELKAEAKAAKLKEKESKKELKAEVKAVKLKEKEVKKELKAKAKADKIKQKELKKENKKKKSEKK